MSNDEVVVLYEILRDSQRELQVLKIYLQYVKTVEVSVVEEIMTKLPAEMTKTLKEVEFVTPGNLKKAPQGWKGSYNSY